MNVPINKPWVSSCLPIYQEFEDLCLVSILIKLQPLFDVVLTKKFIDNLCSVNTGTSSLSSTEVYVHGRLTLLWEVEKFMVNKMSPVSTLYTFSLVNYDW